MTVKDTQRALRKIGWPIAVDGVKGPQYRQAVRDFQLGWNGRYGPLRVTGAADRRTKLAIKRSVRLGGKCSAHFYFREFRSKGNGWIKVHRGLVRGLEAYRKVAGPVSIVSGYRDPAHNRHVGGASQSQHVLATAADLNPKVSADRVRRLGRFSGIGVQRGSGRVRHVDVRHAGSNNTTGGQPSRPTIWFYPG